MRGDVRREALDLDLAGDHVQDSRVGLDAARDAHDLHGHLESDLHVHENPDEIDVQGLTRHGVPLHLFDHRVPALVGPGQLQQKNRVLSRSLAEHVRQGLAIHRDRDIELTRSVDDARYPAAPSGATGFAFSGCRTLLDVELDRLHGLLRADLPRKEGDSTQKARKRKPHRESAE